MAGLANVITPVSWQHPCMSLEADGLHAIRGTLLQHPVLGGIFPDATVEAEVPTDR
jgi:hypothetical protein